jgi:hypothetical protein
MSVRLPVFLHGTGRIPPTILKMLSYVNDFLLHFVDIFQFCLKLDENETLYEYLHTFVKCLTFCVVSTVSPLLQYRETISHAERKKERKKFRDQLCIFYSDMGKLYVLRNHGCMRLNPAFSFMKLFMNFEFKERNRAARNVTFRGHSFRLLL